MQKQTKRNRREPTFSEKRKIKRAVKAYQGDGLPHTVQDTLPFQKIYPDGLCKLSEAKYSRCIEFADISYRLAGEERQKAIFAWLNDLYNSFDPSVGVELTLMTRRFRPEEFRDLIELAARGDQFDDLRAVYSEMLRSQFEKGNNGIVKTKFLVLTVDAPDIQSAKDKLHQIVLDTLNRFRQIGSAAVVLALLLLPYTSTTLPKHKNG